VFQSCSFFIRRGRPEPFAGTAQHTDLSLQVLGGRCIILALPVAANDWFFVGTVDLPKSGLIDLLSRSATARPPRPAGFFNTNK
jgi:hypothetical protein